MWKRPYRAYFNKKINWNSKVSNQENAFENVVCKTYRQVSNIGRTLVGNKIVDNSDVVGASPVGAAPTTSELST